MSETRHLDAISARYSEAHPLSQAHFGRDREVMPGGVKGAYYHAPYPLTMARGDGCYLWDVDGHRYVDFANHHTSQVLGHNHEAVTEAIATQLQRGIALGAAMGNEVELAEEMCSRVKSLERVRFCNSGTEATLHAIRLARGFTGRPKIAKFEGGYHGSHDAVEISVAPALDKAGPSEAPHAVPQVRGMAPHAIDEVLILPYDDESAVDRLVSTHREELACIILDPKAGVLPQRAEFMRSVAETARRCNVPLILDEIVGFRVGTGGIQEHFGITPDLTTFGKIIGGGLPVGAFGGKREFMELVAPCGPVYQAGTLSGNPIAMASGLATLQVLRDSNPYAQLEQATTRLVAGLKQAASDAGLPHTVAQVGSMFTLFFNSEPVTDYDVSARNDTERFAAYFRGMLEQGIYLPCSQFEANFVSTAHSDDDIDQAIAAAGAVLGGMAS